jgi:hypothetical protein
MPDASLSGSEERGKRWLRAKVEQILAEGAVPLATPRAEGDPSCSWGTSPETCRTLYVRLEGDPEPKALHFRCAVIEGCGTGLYLRQDSTVLFIRRTLRKMGVLSP